MTTARAVETSVTVNKNNPIQDYVYPDDHTQRGGHWDFRFCGFGYFLDRFFGFVAKDFGFSVLVVIAVRGFFVF